MTLLWGESRSRRVSGGTGRRGDLRARPVAGRALQCGAGGSGFGLASLSETIAQPVERFECDLASGLLFGHCGGADVAEAALGLCVDAIKHLGPVLAFGGNDCNEVDEKVLKAIDLPFNRVEEHPLIDRNWFFVDRHRFPTSDPLPTRSGRLFHLLAGLPEIFLIGSLDPASMTLKPQPEGDVKPGTAIRAPAKRQSRFDAAMALYEYHDGYAAPEADSPIIEELCVTILPGAGLSS
jgi:hypothetical protein